MPQYIPGTAPAISPGDGYAVWAPTYEYPAAGGGGISASQAVAPTNGPGVGGNGYVFKIQFNGAPGTFEVDCQESDYNTDSSFQTVAGGNITAVDSTNQTADFEAPYAGAKFLKMLVRTLGNAVKISGTIRQR